ncbi:MAG: Crp/Fnr family transcriptional regulator [Desulfobulbaceae bacterium]|nr:MAG: Crp/Fnr family transcriptional regulator [Desulfobulbaceae bacterium]
MKTRFSEINLIKELSSPRYQNLHRHFVPKTFANKALMFGPRHDDNLVYLVERGNVRVYLAMEDREFTLSILNPGDIYATHTSAYNSAMGEVRILTMETMKFYSFLAEYPELSKIVIAVLGSILKQSFAIIDSLSFKDIRKRLAEFILFQSEGCLPDANGAITVPLGMTMEQIAAIVGSTRQTVSTILNDMIREGVVQKTERGIFIIPNICHLRNFE